jgi:tetratricopeptide (TPR) repeat protein
MWSLILPPVIVVIALGFILWYLAVRGTDPQLREVAADIPDTPGLKTRLKAWVVRVTERMVSRSRIAFLRMHNRLSGLATRLRQRRNQYAKVLKASSVTGEPAEEGAAGVLIDAPEDRAAEKSIIFTSAVPAEAGAVSGASLSDSREVSGRSRPEAEPHATFSVLAPLRRGLRQERSETETGGNGDAGAKQAGGSRKKGLFGRNEPVLQTSPRQDVESVRASEETLIARIAENPKDFSAYEALGDYYMESGNIQDAKECYRQVLKLSPAHRGVKMKIRRMERLLSQKG